VHDFGNPFRVVPHSSRLLFVSEFVLQLKELEFSHLGGDKSLGSRMMEGKNEEEGGRGKGEGGRRKEEGGRRKE
jgi:hypothetical protein